LLAARPLAGHARRLDEGNRPVEQAWRKAHRRHQALEALAVERLSARLVVLDRAPAHAFGLRQLGRVPAADRPQHRQHGAVKRSLRHATSRAKTYRIH